MLLFLLSTEDNSGHSPLWLARNKGYDKICKMIITHQSLLTPMQPEISLTLSEPWTVVAVNNPSMIFMCQFCTLRFISEKDLQRHSRLKHNTEIEVEIGSDVEILNEDIVQFIQNT